MVKLRVNGQEQSFDGDPSMPLLWYLRDELGLTGTKFGCGMPHCAEPAPSMSMARRPARASPRSATYQRPLGDDDRRPRSRRQPSGAEGLAHRQRAAMRLLPVRADHAGGGLAGNQQEPVRERNPQRHERQHLPLRLLSAHHRRHQGGGDGGMTMTALNLAIENVSRRGFLRGMLATGGLVVAAEFLPARAALAYATGAAKFSGGVVSDPHVFVSIDPSGIVTIIAHRAEMGTGSRTSLPMVVADELEADWARVRVKQSPGDEKKYGNQNTDGSRSLRHFIQPMRQCGAAARHMLEAAAATQWGVDVAEVAGAEPRSRPQADRPQAWLWRSCRRGERIADARRRPDQAEGPGGLSLYRQGQRPDRRSVRHHDRPRHLRHRCQVAGHEIRGRRAGAGAGRASSSPTMRRRQ